MKKTLYLNNILRVATNYLLIKLMTKIENKTLNIFSIRGGETKNRSSSPKTETKTETISYEEYIKDYKDEIDLDDINRLNRAYKPKRIKKTISNESNTFTLKDKPVGLTPTNDNQVIIKPVIKEPKPFMQNPEPDNVIEKPIIANRIVEKPIVAVEKPVSKTPVINPDNVIEKPVNAEPIDVKKIGEKRIPSRIIDELVIEKTVLDNKKNKLVDNSSKVDYKDYSKEFDQFKKDSKNKFESSKIASEPVIERTPVSITNKEIVDNFVLKNKFIFKFISHSLNFIILYFYIQYFRLDILKNSELIYVNFKNKKNKDSIKPGLKLIFILSLFLLILSFGARLIESIFSKICYFVYISIVFLKNRTNILNKIYTFFFLIKKKFAKIGLNIIYVPEELYFALKSLFAYSFNGIFRRYIDSFDIVVDFLLHNPIGQILNRPLINNMYIKLYSYLSKEIFHPLDLHIVQSGLNVFSAHKKELQSLFKLDKAFEEYRKYCILNKIEDPMLYYLIGMKRFKASFEPLFKLFTFNSEYQSKYNKFMCELYNVQKNYTYTNSLLITKELAISSSSESSFKPNTFLFKLFDEMYKFKLYDEKIYKKTFQLTLNYFKQMGIPKSVASEFFIPDFRNSLIPLTYIYRINAFQIKRMLSINIPIYFYNNKDLCGFKTSTEIISDLFDKKIFKFIFQASVVIPVLYTFFICLKKRIPKKIKDYFKKLIENIIKDFYDFF